MKGSGFGAVILPVAGNESPPPTSAATPFRKTVTWLPGLAGLPHPFCEPSLFNATAATTAAPASLGSQVAGDTLGLTNRDGRLFATANVRLAERSPSRRAFRPCSSIRVCRRRPATRGWLALQS